MTTNTITASDLYAQFTIKTRDDGTTYVTAEPGTDAHDLIRDIHREQFGGLFPNDWIYSTTRDVLELMSEESDSLDSLVDVYTSDLINWVQVGAFRGFVDEAMEQSGFMDLNSALMAGQYLAIEAISNAIESFIAS